MSNKSTITRFDWERELLKQGMNGDALRVAMMYGTYADANTRITFPSIRDIADHTGLSVERVGKFRKALLDTGWLTESDEKTSRGNAKLVLTVGQHIEEASYLGTKKAVSAKSMINLVPAAKQKKQQRRDDYLKGLQEKQAANSLDTPDTSRLEHRGNTRLEDREVEVLDTPDVTTTINNHSLSTKVNQTDADAPVGVQEGDQSTLVYDFSSLSWEELQEGMKKKEDSPLSPCVEDREPSLVLVEVPASQSLSSSRAVRADSKTSSVDKDEKPKRLWEEYREGFSKDENQRFDELTRTLGRGPKLKPEEGRAQVLAERDEEQW